jgi:hypothetical protein
VRTLLIATFNPNHRGESVADCLACLAGLACTGDGLDWPDGECEENFYCPASSTSTQENSCDQGYFCPAKSQNPKPCPIGFYQPASEQSSCLPCPAGKICEAKNTVTPTDCPEGFYCLGTFSIDSTGANNILGQLSSDSRTLVRCGCDDKSTVCGENAPTSDDCDSTSTDSDEGHKI